MSQHLVIENGRFFDGNGGASSIRHLRIRDGIITEISDDPLPADGARVIDATDQWITPGFVDIHTHYDAEVLAAPGLHESVRHGVTTVLMGSCSLSTVLVGPEDAGDLFARVEALPRDFVVRTLEEKKTWTTPAGYVEALEALPLGPNIGIMLGHSELRTHVMGLDRAVDSSVTPTTEEMDGMLKLLDDALDAGFIGLSTMTNPWDKMDGDRYRSYKLPSVSARWSEFRKFNRILRERERVLQSAPNITTKVNVVLYLLESMGVFRKPLKTALISGADIKAEPFVAGLITRLANTVNRLFNADFKWQSLPVPFEVYADGMDLVVFEEFGAGEAALHLKGDDRMELLVDPEYRTWFKKNYAAKFSPRVWHRDFYDATIVKCPDEAMVGKTIGQVADEQGKHPVDAFLDLVVAHDQDFRWTTVIANHRPKNHRRLLADDSVQIGFADSGAHLRNMAFYNFPLHLLKMAKEHEAGGMPFLSPERAVQRLTSELADWYGLDTGRLAVGARADLVVIDAAFLDDRIFDYAEAPMPGCPGVDRMVRRNDETVTATVIGGELVFEKGTFVDGFGEDHRTGAFLRAGKQATSPESAPAAERAA